MPDEQTHSIQGYNSRAGACTFKLLGFEKFISRTSAVGPVNSVNSFQIPARLAFQ